MVLEEVVPYDVMQSQLFVLRVLSQCMEAHWKAYRDQLTQHLRDEHGSENGSTLRDGASTNGSVTDTAVSSIAAAAAARHSDPPPLEDALAKYVLSVLSRFLNEGTHDNDPAALAEPTPNPSSSNSNSSNNNNNNNSNNSNNNSKKKADTDSVPITALHNTVVVQDPELSNEIYKTAGRILFYISASNWPIVFARLKARIQHLSTTNDDWPETAELKLLETASLNQRRLGQVLTGICTLWTTLMTV
jgi:hypothetical protein